MRRLLFNKPAAPPVGLKLDVGALDVDGTGLGAKLVDGGSEGALLGAPLMEGVEVGIDVGRYDAVGLLLSLGDPVDVGFEDDDGAADRLGAELWDGAALSLGIAVGFDDACDDGAAD